MAPPLASLGSPIVFARVLEAAREAGMDVASLRELHGDEAVEGAPPDLEPDHAGGAGRRLSRSASRSGTPSERSVRSGWPPRSRRICAARSSACSTISTS